MGRTSSSLRRFFVTTVIAGLILGLALAAGGLWLALREKDDFDARRQAQVRSLSVERVIVQTALREVHQRLAKITVDVATGQERIRQTEGVIVQLKGLDSTWDKLTGDAQQIANSQRREKLEQQQVEAKAEVVALQTEYTRAGWERDGLEIELGKLDRQLKGVEAQSKVGHYLGQAWNFPLAGMRVKGWVILLFGLFAAWALLLNRLRSGSVIRDDRPER